LARIGISTPYEQSCGIDLTTGEALHIAAYEFTYAPASERATSLSTSSSVDQGAIGPSERLAVEFLAESALGSPD